MRSLIASLVVIWCAFNAHADTITVCQNGCDYDSISLASIYANEGDVIQLSAETYQDEFSIIYYTGVTIRGVPDNNGDGLPETIIDGGKTALLHAPSSIHKLGWYTISTIESDDIIVIE